MKIFNTSCFYESTDEIRRNNNLDKIFRKNKKNKERKNWENNNSIWQNKKR